MCTRIAAVGTHSIDLRWLEVLVDRDALVEHKALSFKCFFGELLQVCEDTALQLKNILVPFLLHGNQRFFAANASGAVHHHFLVLGDPGCSYELRKLGEALDLWIDGVLKFSHSHFEVIACVDYRHIILLQHLVPFLRGQMVTVPCRFHGIYFYGDDFWLDLHRPALKYRSISSTVFKDDRAELLCEIVLPLSDCFLGSANCSIDPFGCKKRQAAHIVGAAKSQQFLLQFW